MDFRFTVMKLALCLIVLALLAAVVGKPQRFRSSQHSQSEFTGSSDEPVTSQYPFAEKIITFLRRIATGFHLMQNTFFQYERLHIRNINCRVRRVIRFTWFFSWSSLFVWVYSRSFSFEWSHSKSYFSHIKRKSNLR